MARNRSNKNAWMPQHTKLDGKWFVYYRQSTKEYKRLCPANAAKWEKMKAYDLFISEPESNFNDCINAYLESNQFKSLAPGTQKKYMSAVQTSKNKELRFTFGSMQPEDINAPLVTRFMDSWHNMPEKANSMHTALSAIFVWCIQRGFIVGNNPCSIAKKYPGKKGGRYVEDIEYKAFFNFLIDNGKTAHAGAMAIAYLCGSRQQDVLRLTKHRPFQHKENDCYAVKDGLVIYQQKTGKVQLKLWSDELRQVYNLCTQNSSPYVISSASGGMYTRGGFNSTWQRMKTKAREQGVIKNGFRFHDMKIKASSDVAPDKRHLFLGGTQQNAERYNRTPDSVDTVR